MTNIMANDADRITLEDTPNDEGGWQALEEGAQYYVEAMGYTDIADHDERIKCFRAAEVLYLEAAEKGNPYAWQNLGYIYSYDRCEGQYLGVEGPDSSKDPEGALQARETRAFECYQHAADAGLPEATYKLGDMYKHGTGCEADAVEAFRCYKQAFDLGKNEHPVIWGSVALRLADCYENAFGCEQSFAKALKWYEQAVTGLDIAVRDGEWFYKKALASAQDGVKRCKQELRG